MYHPSHNQNIAPIHSPAQYSAFPPQFSHALLPTKKEDNINLALEPHYAGNTSILPNVVDKSANHMDLNDDHISKGQRASISIEKKLEICEVKIRDNMSNKDLAAKYNSKCI